MLQDGGAEDEGYLECIGSESPYRSDRSVPIQRLYIGVMPKDLVIPSCVRLAALGFLADLDFGVYGA
jgi:hypothetical protein